MFITSKNEDIDIIIATNMGGDDYLVKPFSIGVLLAKVAGLLRRAYSYYNCEIDIIFYNGLISNIGKGVISSNGKEIELTKNEVQILTLLLKNRGNAVSRERIIRSIWKDASFSDNNTLTVNIGNIRKNLNDLGLENYIETKKSFGYMV